MAAFSAIKALHSNQKIIAKILINKTLSN